MLPPQVRRHAVALGRLLVVTAGDDKDTFAERSGLHTLNLSDFLLLKEVYYALPIALT